MPTALGTVQAFMAAFIEAWPTADTTALGVILQRRRPVSQRSAGARRGGGRLPLKRLSPSS